jgi:hypothetical protein
MADSKISALPASTTPLAGTEVLPIVQSSTTRQVSVANLTAGRAISATQLTLTTGNLIVASGQGIDFSATSSGSGTMTSELLADYEEGTWTPTQGAGLTVVGAFSSAGKYTKIGRSVTARGTVAGATSIAAAANAVLCSGLPFAGTTGADPEVGSLTNQLFTQSGVVEVYGSDLYSTAMAAAARLSFSITYFV